ncbi:type II toxin-antitoxin system RelE/ParE family toxin [Cellvibrio sp. KY-GH-1]|uniref:type II toxin-antitoxin system RelE/ParE family toxin n=1 Tax=Cellvibrio sp. KY-GH-1 TaxID=2303332 RepID=UPI00124456AB|nr:type II toxin-antitoxin system RelE/ParE family toxin [Cellvibrio sp. KY-GH-1]QEY16362.1 type II toxin-antitoxin system RelE/ParE family toxin [Cellvibrio sp. KY-GH-1]
MDRLFKTRTFNRWCATELTDQALCNAVNEMKRGLIDARLGGDVFKKRIAIPGRGKRAGARTLIATHLKDRWFFIFGFNKNERDNISPHELKYLQQLAQDLLAMNDLELKKVLRTGELLEIHYEEAQ